MLVVDVYTGDRFFTDCDMTYRTSTAIDNLVKAQ